MTLTSFRRALPSTLLTGALARLTPWCLCRRVYIYINKNDNYIFAGAFGLTAFFSGHIYFTTLQYNWNRYDVNYLRRQRCVRAISLHCLTPACWCHRVGTSVTSASIVAPSSAGSRRSHAASLTPYIYICACSSNLNKRFLFKTVISRSLSSFNSAHGATRGGWGETCVFLKNI